MTYEQAIVELERVVDRLQKPDIPLDEAVALYRRGTDLAALAESLLSTAELQVQQLSQSVRERFSEYDAFEDGELG
jgi:exodeoxyribonuclease VII small subunit